MSYRAIIARIRITPIEGAKTLVQGHVLGYQVAVDKSTQDGSLGIFFPTDGQLSEAFATANDLVGRGTDPATGEKLGGYFSESRRVTTQKFMKGSIRSEGFFCPLSYLNFIGPVGDLPEGLEFDEFNGVPICNKYYTPATLRAMERDRKQGIKRLQIKAFPEHFETSHWQRFHADSIPVGTLWYITEKLHGTSARVGNVKVTRTLKWWQKLLNYVGFNYQSEFYKIIVGSRRKVLNDTDEGHWHSGGLRFNSADKYKDVLQKDAILYYEIVGHEPGGKPIMGDADPSKLADKKAQKQWANMPNGMMRFKYGTEENESADFLYRLTINGRDISYSIMEVAAQGLPGMLLPPLFDYGRINSAADIEYLRNQVKLFTEGASVLDRTHIREGVAIRLEFPDGTIKILKNKSVDFGILEGYIKGNDSYVDTEETA